VQRWLVASWSGNTLSCTPSLGAAVSVLLPNGSSEESMGHGKCHIERISFPEEEILEEILPEGTSAPDRTAPGRA